MFENQKVDFFTITITSFAHHLEFWKKLYFRKYI